MRPETANGPDLSGPFYEEPPVRIQREDGRGCGTSHIIRVHVLNGDDVSLAAFEAERAADQLRNREALRPWA